MNILISFNKQYLKPTAVMLRSLRKHINKKDFLNVYYAYFKENRINSEDLKIIYKAIGKTSKLIPIEIDKHLPNTLLSNLSFYPEEIMLKIYSMFYLPECVDRILWIDCDILICHNISNFYYDNNFYKYAVKGVEEKSESLQQLQKCIQFDNKYINVGFLLMNPKWFKNKWTCLDVFFNDIKNISLANKKHIAYEQDLINIYCSGFKFCMSDSYFNYSFYTKNKSDNYNIFKTPAVIHYAGPKPWLFCSRRTEYFFKYWFNAGGYFSFFDFSKSIMNTIKRYCHKK